ncbi:MAG: DciA family protein [Pseudomonadota bacterium]
MRPSKPIVTRPARRSAPAVGRALRETVRDLAQSTRYVDPGLVADWQQIVGAELAALCRPGKISAGRGATLTVFARDAAAAARVQFDAGLILDKLTMRLGPGVVGHVRVVQNGSEPDDRPAPGGLSRFRGR